MSTIILYASKHGATKKCAELIAEKLEDKVELHDLKNEKVPELSQYDKVIIGGAIYAGMILKEVKEFCSANVNELSGKKLGLFISCMNAKEAEKQLNMNFPKELLDNAVVKENLGGEFRFKEMNFFEKLITRMVSKMQSKEDPSLVIDTKKDLSKLSKENIDNFAQLMNKA